MADLNKFEEMLERLVNEDRSGAEELFHEIVVEKSRDIYESLLEADLDDEEVDEATDEEVDESDDEEVDEATDEEVDESDEEDLDEGFDLDEFEVEADPMAAMMGGDAADDMEMDVEVPAGDEDDHHADVGGDEELEDRVMDLEDALDELKAEFDSMMGDEAGDEEGDDEGDMDMDMDDEGDDDDDEAEEESYAFESDDEEVDEAEEETDESAKSASETMREYVEKVSATMGDNGVNNKSAVAGKNDMGGTAGNLNQSKDEKGVEAGAGSKVQGSALNDQNPKDIGTGNINVPGGKAAKAGKTVPAGHGAEKKGKPDTADKSATSTLNKVSSRAK